MRAAIVHEQGQDALDLRTDVTANAPDAGEVKVKIKAAGICHSDLSALSGILPTTVPAVLGHEAAGVVAEVGEGVTHVVPGDHVILCFTPACRACPECLAGQPYLCISAIGDAFGKATFQFDGGKDLYRLAGLGAFAEEATIAAGGAVKIDKDIPFDLAAMLSCGIATGTGAALNTAQVKPGSHVVVIGAGGIGLAVIQGARIAGAATIVAVDPLTSKHESALKAGATHATTPDELAGLQALLTAGRGFDYSFECVGRPVTMNAAYRAARRGGDVIVVGAGSVTDMFEIDMFSLLFEGKRILASMYGSSDLARDSRIYTDLWRSGKLDLEAVITNRIKFEEINEAFGALERGEVLRQVVMFDE